MIDRYARARRRNNVKIREWKSGVVTLTRYTRATRTTPWQPGTVTATAVYTLDARADGDVKRYTSETIEGADRVLIVSTKATLLGAEVDVVPLSSDTLAIDGVAQVIKKIEAVPAGGTPARFHIFIAS